MSKTTTTQTATDTGPNTDFALLDLTGPAVVAGQRLTVGDTLEHDEYGTLVVEGYGWTNGAFGHYLKVSPDEDDADPPAKWSFDRGAPNNLPDADDAGKLSVGGERDE